MSLKPASRRTCLCSFGRTSALLSNRRAGIALIVALSAPLLIAATGLSVDVGYWYQEQESLQSAADAAAYAAATADLDYGATNAQSAGPFALAAANNATHNQFGLTSSTLTLTLTPAASGASPAITIWQASVQIPRGSFFSGVRGPGLPGLSIGTQSAMAKADVVQTAGTDCLMTPGTITVTGGANVTGTNCGIEFKRRGGMLDVGERLGQDYRNFRQHGGRLCRDRWRLADHQYDVWFRLYRHGGNQYAG